MGRFSHLSLKLLNEHTLVFIQNYLNCASGMLHNICSLKLLHCFAKSTFILCSLPDSWFYTAKGSYDHFSPASQLTREEITGHVTFNHFCTSATKYFAKPRNRTEQAFMNCAISSSLTYDYSVIQHSYQTT